MSLQYLRKGIKRVRIFIDITESPSCPMSVKDMLKCTLTNDTLVMNEPVVFAHKEGMGIGNGEIILRLALMDDLHILDRAITPIRFAYLLPTQQTPAATQPLSAV